ncbi:MAG TPA: hypothetical protein PLR74_01595 [Agriterribacter sp.]|nr:hypothetical protein [Agriterribacter sp.]
MLSQKTTTTKFYRHAWLWFMLAMAVIVTGFFKSFFSKMAETDLVHHFHGITCSGWIFLLIIQPFLYSRDKMGAHRKLGKISFILAPLLVISGLMMMHLMLSRKDGLNSLTYIISFLDVIILAHFIFFYISAIKHRHNTQLHARYMAGTVLALLPTGVARIVMLIPALNKGILWLDITYILLELTSIALIIDDKRKGKIYPPYVIALLFFIVQHIGLHFVGDWPLWQKLMNAFAGL